MGYYRRTVVLLSSRVRVVDVGSGVGTLKNPSCSSFVFLLDPLESPFRPFSEPLFWEETVVETLRDPSPLGSLFSRTLHS